ncbi:MAG: hypothetical protein R2787_16160 [Saprospiraceae bacterium]
MARQRHFEHHRQPLLSPQAFAVRVLTYLGYASIILVVSLAIGIAGYHWLAGLGWIDALLNASMILTGMGPVDPMQDDTGKLFASFYALYSGVAFLTTISVFLAPILHRLMHILHLEDDDRL